MATATEVNQSQSSGESLDYKGKVFIEDLTDDDQRTDLLKYVSTFGTVKTCNISKEKDSAPRGVAQYQEFKSVDNLMKKENRPHTLNDHAIYIYRALKATPYLKKLRAQRAICTLHFCVKLPNFIPEDELKRHFAQYGTIVSNERVEDGVKITYDDYDPVDKAIQDNPHIFNNVVYTVEKHSNSAPTNNNSNIPGTSASDLREQAAPKHHKSESELVNISNNGSNVDPRHSTESLDDPNNLSQLKSSITVVDDRSLGDGSRLFGHAIKGVKNQANPDLPNDVPSEWTSKNLQSGDAGGQGEVRIICYKNNINQVAAIKVYSAESKTKKNNKGLDDYLKERRMRAHRELVALKALQGVKNVSQLTPYTKDYTNIPDNQEDAIAGNKLYWIIMNYIEGCTLEQFIEESDGIDLLNGIKLTQKLLLTIKQIHARGVVHRDIKPCNLMVVCDSNSPIETAEIHVIDFGLSYIENHDDDDDWTLFVEKEKYEQTSFGDTLGNSFFRVPQLLSASPKNKIPKAMNVLLNVRRSPTIDASSVCAILFWLITNIEPGPKHRDEANLAPHQHEDAENKIMNKIDEAANKTGIARELLPGLKNQLRNYLMSTFDKGFEKAEHQWTIEQLEYRLASIRHVLEQDTTPFDQQLSNATKSFLSFKPATALSSLNPIKLIFQKVSLVYESAKAKFVAQHSPCSWYDGHCHWMEYQQDMSERKNYDILSYQQNKQSWMLIVVCSVHFNENGDIITLTIGSDFNGVYVELPLGRYAPAELDNLNIEVEFERELINLLQVICKAKHTVNTESVASAN